MHFLMKSFPKELVRLFSALECTNVISVGIIILALISTYSFISETSAREWVCYKSFIVKPSLKSTISKDFPY